MKEPDRTQQPAIQSIDTFKSLSAEKIRLKNGIPVHLLQSGTEDVVKIDLMFRAGNWYQPKPLVAAATNEMLNEGTKTLSSEEIAYQLDYYGAFTQMNVNKDVATVTLLTLNKYLEQTLSILAEIIQNPIFPEKEFQTYIKNKKQQFLLERSKVNSLSRIHFNEALFGPHHPYGKILKLEDHEKVTPQDLRDFHQQYYLPQNCEILVTGSLKPEMTNLLETYLGKKEWGSETTPNIPVFTPAPLPDMERYTEKDNAVQSALRMGKILFNQHHPDFIELNVVNTILGGYFGSRLMKVVREEKGYTYGISSLLIPLVHEGYFVIVSEVGSGVCRDAIAAIKQEIKRLREELVGEQELTMVKNYLRGEILRSFDGPLPTASSYLKLIENSISEDYYQRVIQTISNIQPERIKELANQYLHEDTMKISIAGQCNS